MYLCFSYFKIPPSQCGIFLCFLEKANFPLIAWVGVHFPTLIIYLYFYYCYFTGNLIFKKLKVHDGSTKANMKNTIGITGFIRNIKQNHLLSLYF